MQLGMIGLGRMGVSKVRRELRAMLGLSDGNVVFQPRKVRRSGLWDALSGRVPIYIHAEQMRHEWREFGT